MSDKRFTIDSDGRYFDKVNKRYVTIDYLLDELNALHEENEKLKKERDSLAQGMVNTAKDSADIITKVWESKNKIPTEKVRYWE